MIMEVHDDDASAVTVLEKIFPDPYVIESPRAIVWVLGWQHPTLARVTNL